MDCSSGDGEDVETSDKEVGDKPDKSEDMYLEKEIEPKGKEPPLEPSGLGASAIENPAFDSQATKEASLWNDILFRDS